MNTPPLRPVTTLPETRPGSLLNTARARRASASITARPSGLPISSSPVNSPTSGAGRAAELGECGEHEAVHHQPGLHVGDARAVGDAVADRERPPRGLAIGEHRVAMAHQHDVAARVACRPVPRRRGAQAVAVAGLLRMVSTGNAVAARKRGPRRRPRRCRACCSCRCRCPPSRAAARSSRPAGWRARR